MKKHTLSILFILFILLIPLCTLTNAWAQDKPRLGISVTTMQVSPLLLQHLRLSEGEGVMISNIASGSELEAEGLSQGDILLAVDGHPMNSPKDLTAYIAKRPQNAKVKLDVIQKGEHRQIYVTLDKLPDDTKWRYGQPSKQSSQRFLPGSTLGMGSPNQSQLRSSQNQSMTFSSIISTDQGIQKSTVTITGPADDPNSQIDIQIGSDSYSTRIGDIDQLPEEARNVAQDAISQSGNFNFSFGFGQNDIFEEMMQRHMNQMRQMDDLFNQQFGAPNMQMPMPTPQKPKESPLKPVQPNQTTPKQTKPDDPVPVQPSPNDIRS